MASSMTGSHEISGIAQLCFMEDAAGFQGHLVTADKDQYGLVGRLGDIPVGKFHECCFDGTPTFYDVTVIDHSGFEFDDIVIQYVSRTGGDNCSLESSQLEFHTDRLYVTSKAEDMIKKYFSSQLLGKDCYVCVGPMTITVNSGP